jgi:hypothetical protein
MKKLLNMKKLLMIVGMMLAAATAPVWAAEQAQPATDGMNPPATIAWGEAVDGVQVGLVPLGGTPGDGWGKEQDLFYCPRCAQGVYGAVVNRTVAAQKRVCAVCVAPKPWSATFVAGKPMRMELHVRNLAKEARSVYDASHGGHWSFTFTQVGGGKVWKTSWSREDERTMEGIARSTIKLAVGQQNAVEMDLERHSLGLLNLDGGQPAIRSLPPGKYTVTAAYAHPEHAQRKICDHWHGTVTSGPVAIEIKAAEPETDAQRRARQEAEAKTQVDRKQQIDRERELKQRAIREGGP